MSILVLPSHLKMPPPLQRQPARLSWLLLLVVFFEAAAAGAAAEAGAGVAGFATGGRAMVE